MARDEEPNGRNMDVGNKRPTLGIVDEADWRIIKLAVASEQDPDDSALA